MQKSHFFVTASIYFEPVRYNVYFYNAHKDTYYLIKDFDNKSDARYYAFCRMCEMEAAEEQYQKDHLWLLEHFPCYPYNDIEDDDLPF